VLAGKREVAVNEIQLGSVDNVFVSADLTAASDRMLHSHSMALWAGVIDRLTEVEQQVLYFALGPQILVYPDVTIKPFKSSNGILMGKRLTWVTLNLM
jgi:hypothetical protein